MIVLKPATYTIINIILFVSSVKLTSTIRHSHETCYSAFMSTTQLEMHMG